MKHLLEYNSFDKVTCKCGWSWKIEDDDDRPYWCHKCGYENKEGRYYKEDLKEWKRLNENNNNIDIEKPFSEYRSILGFYHSITISIELLGYTINRTHEFFNKKMYKVGNVYLKADFNKKEVKLFSLIDEDDKTKGSYVYIANNIKELVETLSELNPNIEVFKKLNEDFSWEEFDSDIFKPNFLRSDVIVVSKPLDPYPFEEEEISENVVIRTFNQDTDSEEFTWHRDREDRIVEVIGETDWKVQIDNQIPQVIEKVTIPKNIYHRVIKGTGDLKVKITKL